MRMIAKGGAMAAMGYLPDQLAADNKTNDRKSLPPFNHDCQHMNFLDVVASDYVRTQMNFLDRQHRPACFRNKESASKVIKTKGGSNTTELASFKLSLTASAIRRAISYSVGECVRGENFSSDSRSGRWYRFSKYKRLYRNASHSDFGIADHDPGLESASAIHDVLGDDLQKHVGLFEHE